MRTGDYSYILFKNSYNGSGTVDLDDHVCDYTYISWRLSEEQLDKFCDLLSEKLGRDYRVERPENDHECIVIRVVDQ